MIVTWCCCVVVQYTTTFYIYILHVGPMEDTPFVIIGPEKGRGSANAETTEPFSPPSARRPPDNLAEVLLEAEAGSHEVAQKAHNPSLALLAGRWLSEGEAGDPARNRVQVEVEEAPRTAQDALRAWKQSFAGTPC